MPSNRTRKLLDDVCDALTQYVWFVRPAEVIAVALWVLHTHVIGIVEVTLYLAITSAERRSGKSRLLDVLELLVRMPFRAVALSEAVIFRVIRDAQRTMLLDEVDTIFARRTADFQQLLALLNAGYARGTTVPRVGGRGGQIEEFPTFCAKALAGIGQLPDTISDRSIQVRLSRRRREPVSRFRRKEAQERLRPLRIRLERWAKWAEPRVGELAPSVPTELNDRAADGWETLLAIADLAGGEWPERAREAAIQLQVHDAMEESTGVRLLRDCREAFGRRTRLSSERLVRRLAAMEGSPWCDWRNSGVPISAAAVARILRSYGIHPKVMRIGEHVVRGYFRNAFEDPWSRYLVG